MAKDDFVMFWRGPFSQWRQSTFVVDGVTYNTAEQYMMAEKARLFNDEEIEQAIMMTNDPSKQKAMGRNVRGFDKEIWEQNAKLIVYRGNLAKFSQNKDFFDALMATGDKIIVETSPLDTVWGVGLAEDDPRACDPKQWLGLNWLGECLMKVRADLRQLGFTPSS